MLINKEKEIKFSYFKIRQSKLSLNTMLLNYEQIKARSIIVNPKEQNFGNGSYDVQVGKLISVDGKEHESYCIEPQGMVVAISSETFELAENIIGNATIKNSISNSGILAINIGIIDPGYKGCLSSVLINFGKAKYDIKSGEKFIRVTFHEFLKPDVLIPVAENLNISAKQYINRKKLETRGFLDETFLSLKKVEDSIRANVTKTIIQYGFAISIAIAAIALCFSLYFNYLNNDIKRDDEKYKIIQEQVNTYKLILDEVRKENIEIKDKLNKINSQAEVHKR